MTRCTVSPSFTPCWSSESPSFRIFPAKISTSCSCLALNRREISSLNWGEGREREREAGVRQAAEIPLPSPPPRSPARPDLPDGDALAGQDLLLVLRRLHRHADQGARGCRRRRLAFAPAAPAAPAARLRGGRGAAASAAAAQLRHLGRRRARGSAERCRQGTSGGLAAVPELSEGCRRSSELTGGVIPESPDRRDRKAKGRRQASSCLRG